MKIGFFDSGIGGLTVLHTALKNIPTAEYIYFADTQYVPYGTKDVKFVMQRVVDCARFLIELDISALVIACNTATSIAIDELRNKFPQIPIIGMEPAVKIAFETKSENKKILVFTTDLTHKQDRFKNLIKRLNCQSYVDTISLQDLVHFSEKNIFDDSIIFEYLDSKLKDINLDNYCAIVLGCTHFSYYREHFRKFYPYENIFDGNNGTIKNLSKILSLPSFPEYGFDIRNRNISFYESMHKINSNEAKRYLSYLNLLEKLSNLTAKQNQAL